jgi:hypothetical protein
MLSVIMLSVIMLSNKNAVSMEQWHLENHKQLL